VIGYAGGPAGVFGHSSGAILALEAAAAGLGISKVAAYEPAYVIEGTRPRPGDDLAGRLEALLGQGDRDGAVVLFQAEVVGLPAEIIDGMRGSPMLGWFTGLAHILPYDVTLCGPGMRLPAGRFVAITVPVPAIGGGASPPWLPAAARAVAEAIPGGCHVTLDGQDHGVLQQPGALRPLLTSLPHAAWHDPLPGGRAEGACGAAARPCDPPARSRTRQLSRDREQKVLGPAAIVAPGRVRRLAAGGAAETYRGGDVGRARAARDDRRAPVHDRVPHPPCLVVAVFVRQQDLPLEAAAQAVNAAAAAAGKPLCPTWCPPCRCHDFV
jgi:hypothetical protein